MAILPGNDLLLFIGGVKIGQEISHNLNRTFNFLEKKGIINEREIFMTDKEGAVNISIYVDYFASASYDTLITAAEAQTLNSFKIAQDISGSPELTFSGYIVGYSQSAVTNEIAKVDLQIIITGALTYNSNLFTSLWNTANTGTSDNDQITLPLISSGTYNFVVDWGDGTQDTITAYNQAEVTHTYSTSGTKEIKITGQIEGWQFNNTGDKEKILSISNWGSLILNNNSAFYGCSNLSLTGATGAPTFAVNSIANIFRDCTSLTTIGNIENWDFTGVILFSSAFQDCTSFNDGNINSWDVSSVLNFSNFLSGASVFNQSLNSWNVSSATLFTNFFQSCTAFNGNITSWTPSSVQNFSNMFLSASSFNQDLSGWNISGATTLAGMFQNATAFNNGGVALSWTMGSNVSTISNIFQSATSFNQSVNSWNVSSCATFSAAFTGATLFNTSLSSWDVSSGTVFNSMFQTANAFNQSLATFDVSLMTSATSMLANSAISTANYDATLIAWDALTVQNGVALGATGLTYTAAGAGGTARASLITNDSWSFVGDSGV